MGFLKKSSLEQFHGAFRHYLFVISPCSTSISAFVSLNGDNPFSLCSESTELHFLFLNSYWNKCIFWINALGEIKVCKKKMINSQIIILINNDLNNNII